MLEQNKQSEQAVIIEHAPGRRLTRAIGRLAGLGTIAAGGALAGAMFVPLETQIGPHKAEVTVDFDSYASGEVGGLGAIDKPVDLPLGLGVDIQLKEIPLDSSVQQSEELLSNEDLEAYARLMTEHEQIISTIKSDMVDRAKFHGTAAALLGLGLYASYGKARRHELARTTIENPKVKIAAAAVLFISGVGVTAAAARPEGSAPVNHVFDDTFLEGARIRGKYMQLLVNEYAPKAIQIYNDNESFYDKAIENLGIAGESWELLNTQEGYITVDFTTDRHCNLGMQRFIGALADYDAPDLTLDAGDFTMGGTAFEEQCIAVGAQYTKGKLVLAAGNHDSDITEQQARQHGFTVLDGDIKQVAGLHILGDEDPMRSEFMKPAYQKGEESVAELGARLSGIACNSKEPVDIILVHHHQAAEKALSEDCAQIALSGHTHKFDAWRDPATQGIQIVGGTSGGATRNASTFGPLKTTAEIVRMQFSKSTGNFLRFQRIIVDESANVTVTPPIYRSEIVTR